LVVDRRGAPGHHEAGQWSSGHAPGFAGPTLDWSADSTVDRDTDPRVDDAGQTQGGRAAAAVGEAAAADLHPSVDRGVDPEGLHRAPAGNGADAELQPVEGQAAGEATLGRLVAAAYGPAKAGEGVPGDEIPRFAPVVPTVAHAG